jgi:ATP-dependent DNA helicase RecG
MIKESETIELKELLKDDVSKEVIAFANTEGGTIYIGIDDQGNTVGVDPIDESYTRLTNMIRDSIVPDVTLFVRYELLAKSIIKITVAEGTAKPYFLRKNGIKPSGVYVRQGASSVPASWEQIRQFIKIADGDAFESARSLHQALTFSDAEAEFRQQQVPFSEDKYVTLGIQDAEKNLFTNLALLLSDQCPHSIKVAVFEDPAMTVFLDRREFSGSVLKQLRDTYAYLMLNNRTRSIITGLDRRDLIDYPPEAIREALLNALIHRDYSFSGSIIISLNQAGMTFVSIGGLLPGLTTNDIKAGISQARNKQLAQVFFRLKHIEAYGTGIRRIFALYHQSGASPEITVTENTFRITLPNMNESYRGSRPETTPPLRLSDISKPAATAQMQAILDYLSQHGTLNDTDIMILLGLKRTRAYQVARRMADWGLIRIQGRGQNKQYTLPQ